MEIKVSKYSYIWWKRRKKLQLFLTYAIIVFITIFVDILLFKGRSKEDETIAIIIVIQGFITIYFLPCIYNQLQFNLEEYERWKKKLIRKIKQKSMRGKNVKWIN